MPFGSYHQYVLELGLCVGVSDRGRISTPNFSFLALLEFRLDNGDWQFRDNR
ncbi:hypothetical protein PILCRDRAFT_828105 [Piloderma croceum F 1598]|uniref:Uncharacterized protein n=1 Tax=Piloderma croceum (strain F 1598) TaxID=765440 RepID=A0A0C3F3B3_PILCF|nr:hypothetical protein PILCRDRAFT_828105 [Piloderma croceum F 1598]